MTSAQPLLEARGLVKHFPLNSGTFTRSRGYVHAVNGVDLLLREGETLGLVGESGCGKSTLGKTLLRLYEPTSGQILFRGEDIAQLSPSALRQKRREMQIIFQDPFSSLNPRMKVREILAEPFDIHRLYPKSSERLERICEVLETVGLNEDALSRFPHEFSGGQRQRIGIARALMLEPQLIVADEPVSALDVSVQSQILNLIQDLKDRFALAMIFISHDLAVIEHVSDTVAVMYLGHIVEYAEAPALYKMPRHPYTKALMDAIPVPDLKASRRKRQVLQGDVPNPIAPPSGCSFHPRCPLATERCRQEAPELTLRDAVHQHKVACHNVP